MCSPHSSAFTIRECPRVVSASRHSPFLFIYIYTRVGNITGWSASPCRAWKREKTPNLLRYLVQLPRTWIPGTVPLHDSMRRGT